MPLFPNAPFTFQLHFLKHSSIKTDTRAMFIAGGTDLGPSMKHRLFAPENLISLQSIPPTHNRTIDHALHIGAMARLIDVQRSPLSLNSMPVLAEALSQIGTHTIQHMGTIGGNIMLDTRCLFYNQPEGWRQGIQGCLKADGTVCHVAPKGKGCYAAHSCRLCSAALAAERPNVLSIHPGPTDHLPPQFVWYRWTNMARKRKGHDLTKLIVPLPDHPHAHRKVRLRASIDYAQLQACGCHEQGGHG